MVARKSSRVKKSTVVYQSPEQPPRVPKNVTPKAVHRRISSRDIELQMECLDDDLSPAQLKAIKEAQKEHEKANDLIKEVRAGNILVPSSQPNTFTIVPPKQPPKPPSPPVQAPVIRAVTPVQDTGAQRGLPPPRPAQFLSKKLQEMNQTQGTRSSPPDVILISDTPSLSAATKMSPISMPITPMSGAQFQQVTTLMASQGQGVTPQQVYKFVSLPSNVPANLVQNQWALRPILTVPPQKQQQMTFLTTMPQGVTQLATVGTMPAPRSQPRFEATGKFMKTDNKIVKRPSPDQSPSSQPPAKKKNPKTTEVIDQSGNWVPLDEYYYGTHEGDSSYTEEKGEYRFKCWYCSKMLYNNVRAMQHIQGHIDASKQQNIDLSDLTQCKHCYKQFDTPFEMQTHVEKVHLSNKVLMCRICEKDFSTPRELAAHMKVNHHACEMPYVCHLCNFRSSMYSDVVDHFKKKHDSSHYMLCLYCLRTFEVKFVNQGWGQTQTYYGHLLKHQTKSATKKCVVCRLTFFNTLDVKNHRKTCHLGHFKEILALSSGGKVDSGHRQKTGSNLKSLNAPSVSKIQDYGEIIFPSEASNTKCIECKMFMSTSDHYKKYVHCTMCRFATSCSVAYANHMMGFHSGQMSSLNLNIPWERPMTEVMYCACGFSSKYGNKIANHLVYCAKWTCYSTKRAQLDIAPGNAPGTSAEEKNEGSILGMLGLVQKSTVATTEETMEIRSKPKLETKSDNKDNKRILDKIKPQGKAATDDTKEKLETDDLEFKNVEDSTKNETAAKAKKEERSEIIDVSEEVSLEESKSCSDIFDTIVKDTKKENSVDILKIDEGEAINIEAQDEKEELVPSQEEIDSTKVSEDSQPEKESEIEQDKSKSKVENSHEIGEDELELMDTETKDQIGDTQEKALSEVTTDFIQSEEKLEHEEENKSNAAHGEKDMDTKETNAPCNLQAENLKDDSKKIQKSEPINEDVTPLVNEMDTLDTVDESQKVNLKSDEENIQKEKSDVEQSDIVKTVEEKMGETTESKPTSDGMEEAEEETSEKAREKTEEDKEVKEKATEMEEQKDSDETFKDEEEVETKADDKPKEEDKPKEDDAPKNEEEQKEMESSSKCETEEDVSMPADSDKKTLDDRRDSSDRQSQERDESGNRRNSRDESSQERYQARDRHHSGSSERSRYEDRHQQDNRSYGSSRSDSYHGNRSSHDQSRDRDRSYDRDRDRDRSNDRDRDRDRSNDRDQSRDRERYDRDRSSNRDRSYDRDRDYNRNRDQRHGDNRSGRGYYDNRGQGYSGGGQGYRGQHGGQQGQHGGYQGNRGGNQGNRGGHQQDRNFNRNYQNRGGYNQNYRGGYRGGYY